MAKSILDPAYSDLDRNTEVASVGNSDYVPCARGGKRQVAQLKCEIEMPDGGCRELYVNEKGRIELVGEYKTLKLLGEDNQESHVVDDISDLGNYEPMQVIRQCGNGDNELVDELIIEMEKDAGMDELLR